MTTPQTQQKTAIYAVRTTSGQERTVVDLMAGKAKPKKLPISAILAPEVIKGARRSCSAGHGLPVSGDVGEVSESAASPIFPID